MAALATPGYATQAEVLTPHSSEGATPQLAQILAAITRPESSGYTAASNGTYLGLWQIGNYHGYDNARLLSNDIDYQSAAALQIFHQQGFGAWETYTNQSYLKYMNPENSPALPAQDAALSNFSDVGSWGNIPVATKLAEGIPLDNFNRAALGLPRCRCCRRNLPPSTAPPSPSTL